MALIDAMDTGITADIHNGHLWKTGVYSSALYLSIVHLKFLFDTILIKSTILMSM